MLSLSRLDHKELEVACLIHSVRMAAYGQEAELLGISDFPPLRQAITDVMSSPEVSIGAFENKTLIGVLSCEPDDEVRAMAISSLVVHPSRQRKGIAHALMTDALRAFDAVDFTVQTALANEPALILYRKFGFREHRRWTTGNDSLQLVKLIRPSSFSESAA